MKKSLTSQEFAEAVTAGLVFVCGAMAGGYAEQGMTAVQWAGAAAALLGSITLAVAVRVWPAQGSPEGDRPHSG